MASGELMDPLGYGVWWTVAAVALILLSLSWLVVAWRIGRKSAASEHKPAADTGSRDPNHPADPYYSARQARLAELDRIEQQLSDQELEPRAAAVEVAAVLREFASVRRGVRAEPLTATELRQLGWTGGTGELVAALLDPAFSAPGATEGSALTAVHRAREVISRW